MATRFRRQTKRRPEAASLGRLEVVRSDARKILGGIAERTFATLEADGVIVPARRGRGGRPSVYAIEVIVPAYLAFATGQRQTTDRAARARRDTAIAELNELKLAKERGELLERDIVVQQGQAFCKAWSAKARSLPRRARQSGVLTNAEQEAGLTALVRELLTEIASWRTLADTERVITDEGISI